MAGYDALARRSASRTGDLKTAGGSRARQRSVSCATSYSAVEIADTPPTCDLPQHPE